MLRLPLLVFNFIPLLICSQINIYGIDITKPIDKKELKEWEKGTTEGTYKKKIEDKDCPYNMVFRLPGNEYLFKTDRGNYDNMPERFRAAYMYLQKQFGDASLMETPMGSLTDLKLKRYANGKVYFFTHKWDFDAQEYYTDRGDTLTVTQVWNKINSHQEWIKLEWSSLQKYSILIRMQWKRAGLQLKILNFNPVVGATGNSKKKK